ncbi:MAG: hypothetical protein HYU52_12720 [Acidobacteria bacterium]|nr:hypothetical protein [Acidobacteriota bacterium]
MYDPSGSSFDYANVIFSVLQDCEHRRRSFTDDNVREGLLECAREKLARVKASYLEGMGSKSYWRDLEKEVLETVMPQYAAAAAEQNRRERNGYGVFRGGDLAARVAFALLGLVAGAAIIAIPFIPIFEKAFAFVLALGGWFYPDMVRMTWEYKHYKLLNRLVTSGEQYQRNRATYVSTADVEGEDEPDTDSPARAAARRAIAAESTQKH